MQLLMFLKAEDGRLTSHPVIVEVSKFVEKPQGFACSYGENIEYGIDDYPIHCALKWKEKLWDVEGIIEDKEDLYDHANLQDFGDVNIIESKKFPTFSTAFINAERVNRIHDILKKMLC